MDKPPISYFSGLRFKENIKNCDVYDINNVRLGRLLDAIIKKSENGWELCSFTIGGSRWEELLEDLKIKPDIDPVFPVEVIESVTPKSIKLSVSGKELKSTTVNEDAIPKGSIKLSNLNSMEIVDSNDEKLGTIIDMKFVAGNFQFVLGDGFFKEALENIGLREDIDFLLSPKYIDTFDLKKFKLTKAKTDLNIIFKESIKPDFKVAMKLQKAKNSVDVFYPNH